MIDPYQLHVDVFDASGNKVGTGPLLTATQFSITRELDGVGSFNLNFPASDYQVVSELVNERRIEVYTFSPLRDERVLIGSGIARNLSFQKNAGGETLVVSGPDRLDELKRVNTWIKWEQSLTTIATIFEQLVALDANWTASLTGFAGTNDQNIRLDGLSALAGLQELTKRTGIHFRLSTDGGRTIEGGAFGDDSGVTLTSAPSQIFYEMNTRENTGLFESITLQFQSEEVVNTIVPLGPGDFEAALNLAYSTRTSPYTITSFVANGITLYKLTDAASVTLYGAIEKMLETGVSAISNSEQDLINAANASYDLAATFLQRYSVKQEVFSVTVRNLGTSLKPGQKVRVVYGGFAYDKEGNPAKWLDINDDYWVLQVTERFDLSGRVQDLQLSNVDIPMRNGARIVIGELERIKIGNVIVKPYLSKDTISFPPESIDSTNEVVLPFAFGAYTRNINQVILRVWTRPFRVNVTGAAAGGDHVHRVFRYQGVDPGAGIRDLMQHRIAPGTTYGSSIIERNTSSTSDIYTYDASGDHTHDMVYGIFDDTETPTDIEFYVDQGSGGTPISGGPYATLGEELELEIDITSEFSQTSFAGQHYITVACDSGQGLIIAQIEIRETISSIKTTGI